METKIKIEDCMKIIDDLIEAKDHLISGVQMIIDNEKKLPIEFSKNMNSIIVNVNKQLTKVSNNIINNCKLNLNGKY